MPPALSKRCDRQIDPALEAAIMSCLAKDPGNRPASAGKLAELLGRCPCAAEWSDRHAVEWWDSVGPTGNSADGQSRSTLSAAKDNEEFTTAPTQVNVTETGKDKLGATT